MIRVFIAVAMVLASVTEAAAQGRGVPVEWMTAGGDAQRSSWIRSDPKISVPKLQKPGFALDWKIKLNEEPGMVSTLDHYIGYRGFRSLALMGSASGELTAIDTDLGRIEWTKKLPSSAAQASARCPGGMTANVTRATVAMFPASPMARGGGGGRGGAVSAVGEPGEGAVTIPRPSQAFSGEGGRGRGAAPPPGFRRPAGLLDVISSDGMLHSLYLSNGEEPSAPIAFLPPNADARQMIVVDSTAYAATTHSCGGASNGIRAFDFATKNIAEWDTSADVAGFAFGPDSTVFPATTGGDLVALEPSTLKVKSTYHAANESFNASPVILEYKNKALIAVATREGHIHLVDALTLTGAAFPASAQGSLATWADSAGTRWIVAPSKDSLAAWKVTDQGDAPALETGWTSSQISAPLAPIVVNGVVFVVSNSPAAVLHALDGATGKELWNSGKTMTAPVRNGSLSGSGSQLYIGTSDGTIYAFGFPIEH